MTAGGRPGAPRPRRPEGDRRAGAGQRSPPPGSDDPRGRLLLDAQRAGHAAARSPGARTRHPPAIRLPTPRSTAPTPPASTRSRRPSAPSAVSPARTSSRQSGPLAISHARQLAMYLTREQTSLSLAQIAREFNRDHSTVLHAIRTVASRLEPAPRPQPVSTAHELLASTARLRSHHLRPPDHATSPQTPSTDPITQSIAMNPTSPQPSTTLNTSETDRKMQDPSMKLSISRDTFLAALQVVGRAVSTRAAAAVARRHQAHRRRRTSSTLSATDTELGLTMTVSERDRRGRGNAAASRAVCWRRGPQPAQRRGRAWRCDPSSATSS